MYLMFLNPVVCMFLSLLIAIGQQSSMPKIVPILGAFICACFIYVLEKRYAQLLVLGYLLVCCFYKEFLYYLPVVAYMAKNEEHLCWRDFFVVVPVLFYLNRIPYEVLLSILTALLFAFGLKVQYQKSEQMKQAYRKQRDATQELALVLSAKNHDLMIQQEQEIRIATLDERNRIAREIHDNVGHLLSSALLQIGAMQIVMKEDAHKETLASLRETISTAMDSVRSSVHDLHVEALDLNILIQKLLQSFHFCKVDYEYDVVHPFKQNVIYHIAAIIKECLNNTMRHSNATKLSIIIREQPAFYQVILNDNGTESQIKGDGIGLHNIRERVESLHGYVNITAEDGFRVFITLPKEEAICEC